jgi:thiol-disulfide isomerase/thioredoxin
MMRKIIIGMTLVSSLIAVHAGLADDPKTDGQTASARPASAATQSTAASGAATTATGGGADGGANAGADANIAAGRAEVQAALSNIATAIKQATRSRATVELTTRSMIDGRVIASETSLFQIASKTPNLYRIHLKGDQQQIQIVCDGELASVVLDAKAYFQVDPPASLQAVVISQPAPLGPYPEPLMAMTLAGVDVTESLLTDMSSLEVADHDDYEDTPAIQLRGTQADGVKWVLWLSTEEGKARPLRMKVDLTPILVEDNGAGLPDNFALELDYKFTLWRMNAELPDTVFVFKPPADAPKYESLADFAQAMESQIDTHSLLGTVAPDFTSELLDKTAFELNKQRGKVVILDFWATWCGPCIEAMPVITEVAQAFAEREVVLYAVNIGQSAEEVQQFLTRLKIDVPVVLDPEGKIADAYAAEAIPQTVLIGRDGRIEAVHIGFAGLDALKQELTDQLEILVEGGKLFVTAEE